MIANTKRKSLMISAVRDEFPKSLATQETGNVFTLYRDELEWLANFLTGNKNIAAACVIDAWAQAESETPDFQQWPLEWARVGTIRSAVQIQQQRIAQLSSAYMARPCIHSGHAALSGGLVEIVIEESSALIMKMDVLCRCALVICGLEQRSTHEAALMLGVNQCSVEGAYCAAIHFLKVLGYEQFQGQNEFTGLWN
jgi:DNA-directed RNA polymerase specialized sigma24 family protein